MHLATLITNTDFSKFAQARPDDGQKFAAMIAGARPEWQCTPFWVCKGEFPEDIGAFDGVMITGSPASVLSGAPWITRLETLVRQVIKAGLPLFGACFGHQLIARVLGAQIVPNPEGWGHGRLTLTRTGQAPWSGPEPEITLYGSHSEQVESLPDEADLLFSGPGCPVAGFGVGDSVFTIQHHPEMTHAFISDLVEEYAEAVGPVVTDRARSSLKQPADSALFAAEIARFLEHAARAR
jgi:GMP synthase-like glutamine amidotransferase